MTHPIDDLDLAKVHKGDVLTVVTDDDGKTWRCTVTSEPVEDAAGKWTFTATRWVPDLESP